MKAGPNLQVPIKLYAFKCVFLAKFSAYIFMKALMHGAFRSIIRASYSYGEQDNKPVIPMAKFGGNSL